MARKAFINAIHYYFPETLLKNEDLQKIFPDLKLENLTRLTGIKTRHTTPKGITSVDLAVEAAKKLFSETGYDKQKIGLVMFCTQVGDYITPASSGIIHHKLGLKASCGSFDYNQGCTGYLYGLSIAKGLIESGQAEAILMLTSTTITRYIHVKDKSNRAIFGDGSTATLISTSEIACFGEIGSFVFGTDGSGFDSIIIRNGGERFPLCENEEPDFQDENGNIRNHSNFYMNGTKVFNFSVDKGPLAIREILSKEGLDIAQVDLFILHQANRIILESIFLKMGIPESKQYFCLADYGNTVANTIPLALAEANQQGKIQKGAIIVLSAFGVGLSWSACIVRV